MTDFYQSIFSLIIITCHSMFFNCCNNVICLTLLSIFTTKPSFFNTWKFQTKITNASDSTQLGFTIARHHHQFLRSYVQGLYFKSTLLLNSYCYSDSSSQYTSMSSQKVEVVQNIF